MNPVPPSPESQEDEVDREDDEISLAPGSQERVFLDEEESDHPTDFQTVKRVPSSGATISHQTVLMVLLFLGLTVLLFLKRTQGLGSTPS